jgi:hypothetical protein
MNLGKRAFRGGFVFPELAAAVTVKRGDEE